MNEFYLELNNLEDAYFLKRPSDLNKSPYVCNICLKQDFINKRCIKIFFSSSPQLDCCDQLRSQEKTELKVVYRPTQKTQYYLLANKNEDVYVFSYPKMGEVVYEAIVNKDFLKRDEYLKRQMTLFFIFRDIKKQKLIFDFQYQQVKNNSNKVNIIKYVETKNVIVKQGKSGVFPAGSFTKKLGKTKVISLRSIKQLYLVYRYLTSNKDECEIDIIEKYKKDQQFDIKNMNFEFCFILNRSDVEDLKLGDFLFSDLLYLNYINGCEVNAYKIDWIVDKNQAKFKKYKKVDIQFNSPNIQINQSQIQKQGKQVSPVIDENDIKKYLLENTK